MEVTMKISSLELRSCPPTLLWFVLLAICTRVMCTAVGEGRRFYVLFFKCKKSAEGCQG